MTATRSQRNQNARYEPPFGVIEQRESEYMSMVGVDFGHRELLRTIRMRVDAGTEVCRDTVRSLAWWSGMSEREVQRGLVALKQFGLIQREKQRIHGGPRGLAWSWATIPVRYDDWPTDPLWRLLTGMVTFVKVFHQGEEHAPLASSSLEEQAPQAPSSLEEHAQLASSSPKSTPNPEEEHAKTGGRARQTTRHNPKGLPKVVVVQSVLAVLDDDDDDVPASRGRALDADVGVGLDPTSSRGDPREAGPVRSRGVPPNAGPVPKGASAIAALPPVVEEALTVLQGVSWTDRAGAIQQYPFTRTLDGPMLSGIAALEPGLDLAEQVRLWSASLTRETPRFPRKMLEGWLLTGIQRHRSRPREGAPTANGTGDFAKTAEAMIFSAGLDRILRENEEAKAILRLHPRNRVEEAAEQYARSHLQEARDGSAGGANPDNLSDAQRVARWLTECVELVIERNAADPVLRLDHHERQMYEEFRLEDEARARAASAHA